MTSWKKRIEQWNDGHSDRLVYRTQHLSQEKVPKLILKLCTKFLAQMKTVERKQI